MRLIIIFEVDNIGEYFLYITIRKMMLGLVIGLALLAILILVLRKRFMAPSVPKTTPTQVDFDRLSAMLDNNTPDKSTESLPQAMFV